MRLTADMWVSAYLARLRVEGIPAFVVARGDPTAGAVLVKQSPLDGTATLHERGYDPTTGAPGWRLAAEGPEREVDAAIARQRGWDRDLWVIEVEDRGGRHLLGEPGLEE